MNASNDSNYFCQLAAINVNDHVERKGQFAYLSWPYAVAELRKFDATATWHVQRFDGLPYLSTELGVFVECAVTVKGVTLSQIHPVLDAKNRPIMAPTAFELNTSLQRCLVKAIALHGLGLYIYAGEDLPETGEEGQGATGEPAQVPVLGTSRGGLNEAPATLQPSTPTTVSKPIAPSATPLPRSDVITPAQAKYIRRLIEETATDPQKVLDYFGVERIEDIARGEASRVIRSLEQARNRSDERRAA